MQFLQLIRWAIKIAVFFVKSEDAFWLVGDKLLKTRWADLIQSFSSVAEMLLQAW